MAVEANDTLRRRKSSFFRVYEGGRCVPLVNDLSFLAGYCALLRFFAYIRAVFCAGCLGVYETMISRKNAMLSGRWSR